MKVLTISALILSVFAVATGAAHAHGIIIPPEPPAPPPPPVDAPPDVVPTPPFTPPPDVFDPPPAQPPVSPPPQSDPGAPPTVVGLPAAIGRRKKAATLESASTWDIWWKINRDRFIDLRAVVRDRQASTSHNELFLGRVPADDDSRKAQQARMRAHVAPFLKRGLADDDHLVRAHSVFALGKLGEPIKAKEIAVALRDESKTVRDSAVLALGLLASSDSAALLAEIAQDTKAGRAALGRTRKLDGQTRVLASLALGLAGKGGRRAGSAGTPVLLELARSRHPNADLNIAAAMGLGVIGARESVPALIALLEEDDVDGYVRATAANSLGKIGEVAALAKLMEALDDGNVQVRRSATVAVGEMSEPAHVEVVEALLEIVDSGRDRIQRNFAIMSLGRIGGDRARARLRALVADGDTYERTFGALALGVDAHLREKADDVTAKLLVKTLKASRTITDRGAFVVALGLLGHDEGAPYLRGILANPGDPELRGHAAIGLGLMRDRGAVPTLRETLMTKGSPRVQTAATIALGLIGDDEATKLLEEIFRKESFVTARNAALRGLGMIGHDDAALTLGRLLVEKKGSGETMTRAFAADGLGLLSDKDDIPAMATLAEATNFTCSRGILDRVLRAVL